MVGATVGGEEEEVSVIPDNMEFFDSPLGPAVLTAELFFAPAQVQQTFTSFSDSMFKVPEQ